MQLQRNKAIRISDIVIFATLLGVLIAVLWLGWSTWEPRIHEIECRGIRSEYLAAANARVNQLQIESRFNEAGCKGSLLNTFLPAGSR